MKRCNLAVRRSTLTGEKKQQQQSFSAFQSPVFLYWRNLNETYENICFDLGCLFFNPTLNLNPTCHSRCWKHHVWFWPSLRPQRHQVNSFHTFNKSSWSYKIQKIRLRYWLPWVAGCLLPNLRPLKGQHNERRGFRGQFANVKPPGHMKGDQANPRRPPLSSLTADLSKLGWSPPPWLVWNVHYVLGNWKQRGEGNGGQVA